MLTTLGVVAGWISLTPALAAIAAAMACSVAATPLTRIGDIRPALAALFAWAVVFVLGPPLTADPVTTLGSDAAALLPTVAALAIAALVLAAIRSRELRAQSPGRSEPPTAELVLSEPSS